MTGECDLVSELNSKSVSELEVVPEFKLTANCVGAGEKPSNRIPDPLTELARWRPSARRAVRATLSSCSALRTLLFLAFKAPAERSCLISSSAPFHFGSRARAPPSAPAPAGHRRDEDGRQRPRPRAQRLACSPGHGSVDIWQSHT
ncbi:hypothetical protein EVAR_68704_1 [Eumeta japonica]|uniref:Uncharacterized protein n=1 Tax=Eumeta variegata TaxID=151549 RepID=A0A4C2A190_EUMVA|nr:hypothetical protein EVAR_68704_1 [Eumeta japonica]